MEQTKIFEAHYPESVRRFFVINGASIIEPLWNYTTEISIYFFNSPESIYRDLQHDETVPKSSNRRQIPNLRCE